MRYKFTIKGTLPGLNELIEAERRNRYEGARMKKQCETVVAHSARQLGNVVVTQPVHMVYHWHEKNRRRDKDNISAFGRKVIQDALVKAGYLLNDGWLRFWERMRMVNDEVLRAAPENEHENWID